MHGVSHFSTATRLIFSPPFPLVGNQYFDASELTPHHIGSAKTSAELKRGYLPRGSETVYT